MGVSQHPSDLFIFSPPNFIALFNRVLVPLLHLSPAYPTPSRSLSLSLLPFLCLALSGLIYLARCSRAGGKAPGYICLLPRLDLLGGR